VPEDLNSLIPERDDAPQRELDEEEPDSNEENGDHVEDWDLEVCDHEDDLKERISATIEAPGQDFGGGVGSQQIEELVIFAGGGFVDFK
jgi:hypothetical protein